MTSVKESLEYGIIVGYQVALLEENGEISFTSDYDFDEQFIVLAKQLIREFSSDTTETYFSVFVRNRLRELDFEKKQSA